MIWSVRAYKPLALGEERAERGLVRLHRPLTRREVTGKSLYARIHALLPSGWVLAPLTLQAEDLEASRAAQDQLDFEVPSELPVPYSIKHLTDDHRRLLGAIRDAEPRETRLEDLRATVGGGERSFRFLHFDLEEAGAVQSRCAPGSRRPVRWVASVCLPPGDEELLLDLKPHDGRL